jgi:hypothetical protein
MFRNGIRNDDHPSKKLARDRLNTYRTAAVPYVSVTSYRKRNPRCDLPNLSKPQPLKQRRHLHRERISPPLGMYDGLSMVAFSAAPINEKEKKTARHGLMITTERESPSAVEACFLARSMPFLARWKFLSFLCV